MTHNVHPPPPLPAGGGVGLLTKFSKRRGGHSKLSQFLEVGWLNRGGGGLFQGSGGEGMQFLDKK